VRSRLDGLAECDSEQARAKQHKAGCDDCQESIGHEVMIAHGTPAALVLRPREQNDMLHREVKRFSRCFENWKPTDDFEQQLSRTGCLNVCGVKHQRNKYYNKIIYLLELLAAATRLARTRPARRAARATFLGREGGPVRTVRSEGPASCPGRKATVFGY
jgi:hypothetical protein